MCVFMFLAIRSYRFCDVIVALHFIKDQADVFGLIDAQIECENLLGDLAYFLKGYPLNVEFLRNGFYDFFGKLVSEKMLRIFFHLFFRL